MGQRLRQIRNSIDETQTVFGARFNLKRHDIANYERGLADLPSRLMGALDEMGFNITWLVSGDGKMRKVDDLLSRFEELSMGIKHLSSDYHLEREELIRVLAVAETGLYRINMNQKNRREKMHSENSKRKSRKP